MIFKLLSRTGNSGEAGRKSLRILLVIMALTGIMSYQNCYGQAKCPAILVDLVLGEPVSLDYALEDIVKSRIVYLGEHHTIARHHKFQLDIIKGLSEKGVELAVGLEMFSTEQQQALNEWSQSRAKIDDLAAKLGVEKWTNLKDYSEILEYAREVEAPILGLNAPDALVRKVAREGLEGLTEAQQKGIPKDVDDINPQYEKLLRLKLRVHKAFQEKKLERIILAQALRDSVMSKTILDFLETPAAKGRTMIVIAGGGHINYGFGIPERVSKYLDAPYRILLPSESGELVLTEQELRHAAPIEITHADLGFIRTRIADYLSVLPLVEDSKMPEPDMIQAELR